MKDKQTYDTINYQNYIEDPDYTNLISIKNDYFDESGWNKRVELEKNMQKKMVQFLI